MKKVKNTATFEYTNPNPSGSKDRQDCVIRAISIATGKDWLTVYDELCAVGREVFDSPNSSTVEKAYLDKIAEREPVIVNRKRTTAKQLAQRKDGHTYVVAQANHLVAVKDGKVRDTWDSGDRGSYVIWKLT
jgi:hypothetical protein